MCPSRRWIAGLSALGDFRLDIRNILGIPGARLVAAIQGAAAIGTAIRPVIHMPIDVFRRLASSARMSLCSPPPSSCHDVSEAASYMGASCPPRRRSLVRVGRRGSLLLGQLLDQLQERKDDSFLPLRENQPRLPSVSVAPSGMSSVIVAMASVPVFRCHSHNAQRHFHHDQPQMAQVLRFDQQQSDMRIEVFVGEDDHDKVSRLEVWDGRGEAEIPDEGKVIVKLIRNKYLFDEVVPGARER